MCVFWYQRGHHRNYHFLVYTQCPKLTYIDTMPNAMETSTEKSSDRQLSGKILPYFFLSCWERSVENTLGMNEKDKRLPKHLIQLEMQIQRDRLTFAVQ